VIDEDLGLVFQAAEGGAVDDAIAIALKRQPKGMLVFRMLRVRGCRRSAWRTRRAADPRGHDVGARQHEPRYSNAIAEANDDGNHLRPGFFAPLGWTIRFGSCLAE